MSVRTCICPTCGLRCATLTRYLAHVKAHRQRGISEQRGVDKSTPGR